MSRRLRGGFTPGTLEWAPTGPRLWTAVVLSAAVLGYSIAHWPVPSLAALGVLALIVAVLANREFALGAVLVSAMLMLGAIAWFGLPDRASLLTKLLILLFVLGVALDWTPDVQLEIPIAFIMLGIFLGVSAVFGTAGPFLTVQALGAYLVAPLAYLAIVNSKLAIGSLRRLSFLVIFIIAAQVPLMLLQSRVVSSVDDIGGTFGMGGSTQMLAIVFGIAWIVAVALLTGRRALWLIPIGLTIASVLMISQAKAGFLFAAAGTIAVGLTRAIADPRRGLLKLVVYLALGAGVVAALFFTYVYLGPILPGGAVASYFWIHWLSNPSAVMGYLLLPDKGGQAGRLGGTVLALAQVRTMADLLIGHGPGVLSGSALTGESAIASSAIAYALSWATSLTRFVLEVGMVGILVYLAAIFTAVATVARVWMTREKAFGISVTAAATGAAAVFVAGALYHAPWTTDAIAVPFWCLLGMAVRWGRLRAAEQDSGSVPSAEGSSRG